MAGGDLVGRDDVDRHPVLGVHHDQPAVLRGPLHRPEDRPVVAVEDARIRGEELEVRDALGDQLVHLGEGVVVDVAHDHVEAVVGDGVALGLGVPRVEALAQRLRRATGPRSRRSSSCPPNAAARVPVSNVSLANVPPNGSSMWVWTSMAPGITYRPAGVDRLVGRDAAARQARADRRDRLVRRPARRPPYEPSAVTIVPFVISVRIGPPPGAGGRAPQREGRGYRTAAAGGRPTRASSSGRMDRMRARASRAKAASRLKRPRRPGSASPRGRSGTTGRSPARRVRRTARTRIARMRTPQLTNWRW